MKFTQNTWKIDRETQDGFTLDNMEDLHGNHNYIEEERLVFMIGVRGRAGEGGINIRSKSLLLDASCQTSKSL